MKSPLESVDAQNLVYQREYGFEESLEICVT